MVRWYTQAHTSPPFTEAADLVLGNNKKKHNTTIYPGPIMEFHHIPVNIKLTIKAFTRTIPPTPDLSKANWNRFADHVTNEIENIEITELMNKNSIDSKLSQ